VTHRLTLFSTAHKSQQLLGYSVIVFLSSFCATFLHTARSLYLGPSLSQVRVDLGQLSNRKLSVARDLLYEVLIYYYYLHSREGTLRVMAQFGWCLMFFVPLRLGLCCHEANGCKCCFEAIQSGSSLLDLDVHISIDFLIAVAFTFHFLSLRP